MGTDDQTGNAIVTISYWRSRRALYDFAQTKTHLDGWRWFDRASKKHGHLSFFHETYVVPASGQESIAVNMPPQGLLAAIGSVPVGRRGQSAAHRLDPRKPDDQMVAG